MATKDVLFGSGPGNSEVDLIDIAALALLPIFASLQFGVFTWQIQVFGGYDFNSAMWTIGGVGISLTLIIIVFSVAWIVVTNLINDDTDMGQYEAGVTVTALLLPILYVFVPAVADLVTWHDLMRLAAVLYVAVAAVYISYVG